MKWGVRSMIWDVLILFVAFLVALYYYNQLIGDAFIQEIFF